jgi:hypothetical protein
MILKRYQKKIASLISCKNYLLICKPRTNRLILVISSKASNGPMQSPSSSTMFNSFAENSSKPSRKHIKTLLGSNNFSREPPIPMSIVANTNQSGKKCSWISPSPSAINTHNRLTVLLKRV